jgi:hypothetical protein
MLVREIFTLSFAISGRIIAALDRLAGDLAPLTLYYV